LQKARVVLGFQTGMLEGSTDMEKRTSVLAHEIESADQRATVVKPIELTPTKIMSGCFLWIVEASVKLWRVFPRGDWQRAHNRNQRD